MSDVANRRGVTPLERTDRPIPAGVEIGHVHLKAADLGRIKDFYVGILSRTVLQRRLAEDEPPEPTE